MELRIGRLRMLRTRLLVTGFAGVALAFGASGSTAMAADGASAAPQARLAKCKNLKETVNFSVRAINGLHEVIDEAAEADNVILDAVEAAEKMLADARAQGADAQTIAQLEAQVRYFERQHEKILKELKGHRKDWRDFVEHANNEWDRVYDKLKSGKHTCSDRDELKIRRNLDRIDDELDRLDKQVVKLFDSIFG